jgi:hypothetical protein
MKKYRIVLMVPVVEDIDAADIQRAHNHATKMADAQSLNTQYGKAIVHSVEFLGDVLPKSDLL